MNIYDTQEGVRLAMTRERKGHWSLWGPYVSERAWVCFAKTKSAAKNALTESALFHFLAR